MSIVTLSKPAGIAVTPANPSADKTVFQALDVTDRRRPGRPTNVSPALIGLLRMRPGIAVLPDGGTLPEVEIRDGSLFDAASRLDGGREDRSAIGTAQGLLVGAVAGLSIWAFGIGGVMLFLR